MLTGNVDVIDQSARPERSTLKSHHRLLNPPVDALFEKNKAQLAMLLGFSPMLCTVSFQVARLGFQRWCQQGESITHDAVRSTLKTMRNWEDEIVNFHRCCWTNATVEGRQNCIKAY